MNLIGEFKKELTRNSDEINSILETAAKKGCLPIIRFFQDQGVKIPNKVISLLASKGYNISSFDAKEHEFALQSNLPKILSNFNPKNTVFENHGKQYISKLFIHGAYLPDKKLIESADVKYFHLGTSENGVLLEEISEFFKHYYIDFNTLITINAHGLIDSNSKFKIVLNDKIDEPEKFTKSGSTAIADILSIIQNSTNSPIFVYLESCFSGSFSADGIDLEPETIIYKASKLGGVSYVSTKTGFEDILLGKEPYQGQDILKFLIDQIDYQQFWFGNIEFVGDNQNYIFSDSNNGNDLSKANIRELYQNYESNLANFLSSNYNREDLKHNKELDAYDEYRICYFFENSSYITNTLYNKYFPYSYVNHEFKETYCLGKISENQNEL